MSTDLNAAIFEKLIPVDNAAAKSVNDFTRAKMKEDGFARRLFRTIEVRTREEWLAIGVRPEHLITYEAYAANEPGTRGTLVEGVTPAWNAGEYVYELLNSRRNRLDYEHRLTTRNVSQAEWNRHQRAERRRAYYNRLSEQRMFTGEQREEFAYTLMCELVAMIAALAERTDRGIASNSQEAVS